MPVSRDDLLTMLNTLLQPHLFDDYCPNGLQVEGKNEIKHLVTGVTACQALIDAAIDQGADALLVHHGYFWKGENPCVTGMKQRRIKALLENGINLFAYHLPLDAHNELGNNAQLAKKLGLQITGSLEPNAKCSIGIAGALPKALTADEFIKNITAQLRREPFHVEGKSSTIKTVALCTGAAQHYLEKAILLGVDAFLTGEVSEQTVHIARENGIHFFAAGHHATERYGVQAVGEHLSQKIHIKHSFIDISNPA